MTYFTRVPFVSVIKDGKRTLYDNALFIQPRMQAASEL